MREPPSSASLTLRGRCPGLALGAAANTACGLLRYVHGSLGPGDGFHKIDFYVGKNVLALCRSLGTLVVHPKKVREITENFFRCLLIPEVLPKASAKGVLPILSLLVAREPHLIVDLSLFLISQGFVSVTDFGKFLLGVLGRIFVRVPLLSQLVVGFLYFILRGIFLDSQNAV